MLMLGNREDKCLELEIEIKDICRRKRKRTVRGMERGDRAAELE
jgi:hypothetical protein